jgi:hypothetical protein
VGLGASLDEACLLLLCGRLFGVVCKRIHLRGVVFDSAIELTDVAEPLVAQAVRMVLAPPREPEMQLLHVLETGLIPHEVGAFVGDLNHFNLR